MKHPGTFVRPWPLAVASLSWPDAAWGARLRGGAAQSSVATVALLAGLWSAAPISVKAQQPLQEHAQKQTQETVYRCGQAYTNVPRDPTQCERLAFSAITVTTGSRPSVPKPSAAAVVGARPSKTHQQSESPNAPAPTARDVQARTILSQELTQARQQLTELVQAYNQGEPVKWAAEARNHQKYLDRVAALKAAISRTERDIDSLERELARRPLLASTDTP